MAASGDVPGGRLRRGEEIRIAAKDLPCLVRWMPSLKKSIDGLPDDCPGWGLVIRAPGGATLSG